MNCSLLYVCVKVSDMKAEFFSPNEDVILHNEAPTEFYIIINGSVVNCNTCLLIFYPIVTLVIHITSICLLHSICFMLAVPLDLVLYILVIIIYRVISTSSSLLQQDFIFFTKNVFLMSFANSASSVSYTHLTLPTKRIV